MLTLAQTSLQSGSLKAGYELTWRFADYSEALSRVAPQLVRSVGYAGATVAALVLAYPLSYFLAFTSSPSVPAGGATCCSCWSSCVLTSFLVRALA